MLSMNKLMVEVEEMTNCMAATTLELGIQVLWWCGGFLGDFTYPVEDVTEFWHLMIRHQDSLQTLT